LLWKVKDGVIGNKEEVNEEKKAENDVVEGGSGIRNMLVG